MNILNTLSLKINRQTKINFDGVDLFSDAGLLHIKEFVSKLSIDRLFSYLFKTNDSASFRYHTDKENLLQMIYMIIVGYFEEDASDELTNDPVFKAVLNKETLASQPTISRFYNYMDKDSLNEFLVINKPLRKKFIAFSCLKRASYYDRYSYNCHVPDNETEGGWDVIFQMLEGITLIEGDVVHTVYVKMKNKDNSMNSAVAGKNYIKMQS